ITTTLSPGEWRYWIASEKDSILTIDASVIAPVSTLPSPSVIFDRSFSTPGLRGARYSPNGNSYAIVGTNHTTFVSGPFVSSASVGTSNVRLAFPDNQQWLIGDDTLGVYRANSFQIPLPVPQPVATRRTGTVRDMAADSQLLFTTLGYLGLSVFDLQSGTQEITSVLHTTEIADVTGVAILPGTRSAYVADQERGIFHVTVPDSFSDSLLLEQQYTGTRLGRLDWEPLTGRLVSSRFRRGLTLLRPSVDSTSLEELASFNPGVESIDHVAWISPRLVAAAEWDGDVHFIGETTPGNWEPIGFWRTLETTATCVDLDSNGSEVLVAFSNGRVIGLNASTISQLLPLSDTFLIK
ncbi:MAG: hypothetical protein SFY68_09860, partial [Candidatus Sumerlaeia bacterium]|nr:hypothetical protein [Candidatus Sumerlaeia bacterium]